MKRYFIVGTDTDCGKTYVTRQLIDYYPNAAAIKPIASGYNKIDDQLVTDADLLIKNKLKPEDINLWHFALPVSPHIAAEKEGKFVDVSELVDYCLKFDVPGIDRLFIEGAGGLMVPLNNQHTWVDFLTESALPVVLVVGMKLGCINHALLTESVLRSYGIECVGWIANCIDPQMLVLEENIDTLTRLLQAPLLTVIPYGGVIQIENVKKL